MDHTQAKAACVKAGITFDPDLKTYAESHSYCVIDIRRASPDPDKVWHLIGGPGPRNGGELAMFATREEAATFAKAHGINVKFGDQA